MRKSVIKATRRSSWRRSFALLHAVVGCQQLKSITNIFHGPFFLCEMDVFSASLKIWWTNFPWTNFLVDVFTVAIFSVDHFSMDVFSVDVFTEYPGNCAYLAQVWSSRHNSAYCRICYTLDHKPYDEHKHFKNKTTHRHAIYCTYNHYYDEQFIFVFMFILEVILPTYCRHIISILNLLFLIILC